MNDIILKMMIADFGKFNFLCGDYKIDGSHNTVEEYDNLSDRADNMEKLILTYIDTYYVKRG